MTEKQLGFKLIERYCPALIYQIEIHALCDVLQNVLQKYLILFSAFSVQRTSDIR